MSLPFQINDDSEEEENIGPRYDKQVVLPKRKQSSFWDQFMPKSENEQRLEELNIQKWREKNNLCEHNEPKEDCILCIKEKLDKLKKEQEEQERKLKDYLIRNNRHYKDKRYKCSGSECSHAEEQEYRRNLAEYNKMKKERQQEENVSASGVGGVASNKNRRRVKEPPH